MMSLFKYLLENGMKKLADIHEPYQSMLRDEYSQKVVNGEITPERYYEITGEEYTGEWTLVIDVMKLIKY